jgi:periplasmic protein TonB
MALRALVFSSDGSTTSALCHVLTDLGIEAEICSEMLVAVERITSQPYDALLVDWDQQAEAIFLVKQLRELKLAAQALTLALVEKQEDLPEALQAGANSVIRKPIDSKQAHDTLSTAKQLIQGRQAEQRNKELRLAAEQPPVEQPTPVEGPSAIDDPSNADQPAQQEQPKRGFLAQTGPRTGIEAEEFVASAEPVPAPPPQPAPPPVPDPSVRERALSILGYGSKAGSDAAAIASDDQDVTATAPAKPEPAHSREPRSQDTNHEFSSLPEDFDREQEDAPASGPHYGIYAAAAGLLIAGVLWVFAPGDSYIARLKGLHAARRPASTVAAPPASKVEPHFAKQAPKTDPLPVVLPDPDLKDAQDEAASNIQVIESKPIPVAGAQQPPTADASPDAQPVPAPAPTNAPAAGSAPVPAEDSASHPQLQDAAETQVSSAPPHPVAVPLPPVVHLQETNPPDPAAGRTGVIIPDSLKNAPSTSPASSLEPPLISEEASRALILKKVDPSYPPQAIAQHLEGDVILQAYVGQDGSVRDLKLVRGYFLLGRAAFDAVRQWRFKPYSQNGKVVDFQTFVTISFRPPS